MFSFQYIAPFWYQQEAQEPGFLIRKDRREIHAMVCTKTRHGMLKNTPLYKTHLKVC